MESEKSKLHQVLAVEGDLEGTFKKVTNEAVATFQKHPDMFRGSTQILTHSDESRKIEDKTSHVKLETTVADKLNYVAEHGITYIDANLQKEATNQHAVADLIIDGKVIATSLPATFLLGLEKKLQTIHKMAMSIPTLAKGIHWEKDKTAGDNVYRTKHATEKTRTAKSFQHKVLVEATDKFPAQIKEWEEQMPIGKFVDTMESGMLSTAEKSNLLARIDKLYYATKKARQKANETVVIDKTVGKEIFSFILGG